MNGLNETGAGEKSFSAQVEKLSGYLKWSMSRLSSLPQREQAALLAGGLVSAAILGYVYLLEPMLNEYDKMKAEAGRIAERIDRFKNVVETTEDNRVKNREYIENFNVVLERCFTGKTEEIAAGQLSDIAAKKADEAGIALKSTRVEKSRVIPGFRQVSVSVNFETTMSGLARYIKSIEEDPKKIAIVEAKIHSQKERYDQNQEEKLTVDMTLSGLKQLQ